jgi:mannonate dehydratase
MTDLDLMEESFRWYGPNDMVPLSYIRQAGAAAVFTSLHQIPYGDLWPRAAVQERKRVLENAGLRWNVVESVPIHEDIRTGTGTGDLKTLFGNYADTLRHLAAEGIKTVIYNFMPVLDWIRTDMHYKLPDGSEALRFDPVQFAAFDLYALKRPAAIDDHAPEMRDAAKAWWNSLDAAAQEAFIRNIIDVFPGCKMGLNLDDIRAMLAKYENIDEDGLRANYVRFLEAVIPVAEEVGVRLAVHADDPPFPVLGLPRIVSTADHVAKIFTMVDSPANGLCLCAGSFSANPSNDLVAMAKRFGPRIHAVHLRSTQRLPDGSFFEADHLAGSVNMPGLVRELFKEMDRRKAAGREDWRLPFRPDHGHTMMDDLAKASNITPGYSAIGRMRGLAELRGLMTGIRYAERAKATA